MVEYGAGGTITQAAEETAPGGDAPASNGASNSTDGTANNNAGTAAAQPPAAAAATRRKRKAKGWFCPVCRQPYTSLLRLTTSPPDTLSAEDGKELESDMHDASNSPIVEVQAPPPVVTAPPSRGLGSFKPGFLRSLSRGGNTSNAERDNVGTGVAAATLPPDLERGLRGATST